MGKGSHLILTTSPLLQVSTALYQKWPPCAVVSPMGKRNGFSKVDIQLSQYCWTLPVRSTWVSSYEDHWGNLQSSTSGEQIVTEKLCSTYSKHHSDLGGLHSYLKWHTGRYDHLQNKLVVLAARELSWQFFLICDVNPGQQDPVLWLQ